MSYKSSSGLYNRFWPVLRASQNYTAHLRLPGEGETIPLEAREACASQSPELLAFVTATLTLQSGDMQFAEFALVNDGGERVILPFKSKKLQERKLKGVTLHDASLPDEDPFSHDSEGEETSVEELLQHYDFASDATQKDEAASSKTEPIYTRQTVIAEHPYDLQREDGAWLVANRMNNKDTEKARKMLENSMGSEGDPKNKWLQSYHLMLADAKDMQETREEVANAKEKLKITPDDKKAQEALAIAEQTLKYSPEELEERAEHADTPLNPYFNANGFKVRKFGNDKKLQTQPEEEPFSPQDALKDQPTIPRSSGKKAPSIQADNLIRTVAMHDPFYFRTDDPKIPRHKLERPHISLASHDSTLSGLMNGKFEVWIPLDLPPDRPRHFFIITRNTAVPDSPITSLARYKTLQDDNSHITAKTWNYPKKIIPNLPCRIMRADDLKKATQIASLVTGDAKIAWDQAYGTAQTLPPPKLSNTRMQFYAPPSHPIHKGASPIKAPKPDKSASQQPMLTAEDAFYYCPDPKQPNHRSEVPHIRYIPTDRNLINFINNEYSVWIPLEIAADKPPHFFVLKRNNNSSRKITGAARYEIVAGKDGNYKADLLLYANADKTPITHPAHNMSNGELTKADAIAGMVAGDVINIIEDKHHNLASGFFQPERALATTPPSHIITPKLGKIDYHGVTNKGNLTAVNYRSA